MLIVVSRTYLISTDKISMLNINLRGNQRGNQYTGNIGHTRRRTKTSNAKHGGAAVRAPIGSNHGLVGAESR